MQTTQNKTKRLVDEATRRWLAVLCGCDPRSIDKVLAGQRVSGVAGQRIRQILEDQEIPVPAPAEVAP